MAQEITGGLFGGLGREDGGSEELFPYLESEGVGEDKGQDVFGQVGDGYQEGDSGRHACEEAELEGAQEVAGDKAERQLQLRGVYFSVWLRLRRGGRGRESPR